MGVPIKQKSQSLNSYWSWQVGRTGTWQLGAENWMFWLGHENYTWKWDVTPHIYSTGVCMHSPGHIYDLYGIGNNTLWGWYQSYPVIEL